MAVNRARLIVRIIGVVSALATSSLAGCVTASDPLHSSTVPRDVLAIDGTARSGSDSSTSSQRAGASVPEFVLLVAPNMVSNTLFFFFNPVVSIVRDESPSNLWPLITLASPVMGAVAGVQDAAHGYGFWEPLALDEKREYAE